MRPPASVRGGAMFSCYAGRLLCAGFLLLVVACSSTSTLMVQSFPLGARLATVGSDQDLGRAPVLLTFDNKQLNATRTADGCFLVRGLQAEWESGAVTTVDPVALCDPSSHHFEVTLHRPDDVLGEQQDLDFAKNMRFSDMELHRRSQREHFMYFPNQTPTKPNGPAQPTSSRAPP